MLARFTPSTLRGRLAFTATLIAGTAVIFLTATFGILLDRRLGSEAENVLRSRAEAARANITVTDAGALAFDPGRPTELDGGIWLYQGTTTELSPTTAPKALTDQAFALIGTSNRIVRFGKPQYEFLSVALRTQDGRQVGTLVAAITLEPYERSSRATLIGAIGLGTVLVLLVYLVARNVASRALLPVTEMTKQAGEWSASDTSGRFGESDRPGELQDLADTLDGVLGRLSAVLRREQQLSAEISHELRTPLAGIIAEADLYASRPRTAEQSARAMSVVADGARRMERILDTLLTAARAEAGTARGRCNVVSVATRLLDRVDVAPDVPFVGAGEEVVERLLAPLIDNASRYSDDVRLRISTTPEHVLVEVLDDGPGVTPGLEEAIFDAGYRGAPEDGHRGAGLGLALARRLARSAGGDVTAAAGPGGRFTVQLPRA